MSVLRNEQTGAVVATKVQRASNFIDRAIGLLARARVHSDEGLWIDHCNAIHTIGMRAEIDVIFLDRSSRVVRIVPRVTPFRLAVVCRKAASVIELGAGALAEHDVLEGDHLELV